MVTPRPHVKYTRIAYPYITGSDCYVNTAWPISKPITIIELFTTAYLLRRGYYYLYMLRPSVCDTPSPPPSTIRSRGGLTRQHIITCPCPHCWRRRTQTQIHAVATMTYLWIVIRTHTIIAVADMVILWCTLRTHHHIRPTRSNTATNAQIYRHPPNGTILGRTISVTATVETANTIVINPGMKMGITVSGIGTVGVEVEATLGGIPRRITVVNTSAPDPTAHPCSPHTPQDLN